MNELIVGLVLLIAGSMLSGLGWLIKYVINFSKENRDDHNVVMCKINEISTDVKDVSKKLENHVDWHLHEK